MRLIFQEIIAIICLLLVMFVLVPSARAALDYSQNFDNLALGSIVGQDIFSDVVNGNSFIVGITPLQQGNQSLSINTTVATHSVVGVTAANPAGSLVAWVNSTGTGHVGDQLGIQGYNVGNHIYRIAFNGSNNFVSFANNAVNVQLAPFTPGSWTRVEYRWDNNTEYVVCVNRLTCGHGTNVGANAGPPNRLRLTSPDQAAPSGTQTIDSVYLFDTFLPDEVLMALNITEPTNKTYNVSNVELNVTFPMPKNATYELDGATNVSVENNSIGINIDLLNLPTGFHQLVVYATDPFTGDTTPDFVNFTTNATAEARFTNSVTGALITESVILSVFNLTSRLTTTTSIGTARFNWTTMPKGTITIEVNSTLGASINRTISSTLGLFEGFNRSFALSASGIFNVSVFDEMKKGPFNFSIVNSTLQSMTLKVFCANQENETVIVSPDAADNNISLSCPVEEIRLTSEFADSTDRPYRALRPAVVSGVLRLWMVENTTEDLIYQQFFTISDLVGTFKEGQLDILKLINTSIETIHQAIIEPDGSAFAYLIDGERYQIRITSSDGTQVKTIDFTAHESRSSGVILEATTLEYNPAFSLLFNDVGWTFNVNDATNQTTLTYVDSANSTTRITYTVRNASNTSQILFTSTSTARVIIYDFSYTTSDINGSYLVSFEAIHQLHGTIFRSVIQNFAGIKMSLPGVSASWYMIFGLFLVIVTALIFGAKFSEIAGVAVALESGLFWYWGWFGANVSLMIILIGIALSVLNMIRRGERT